MRHDRISWTAQALANRADSIQRIGSVSDVMGGEDHREVAVYFEHTGLNWTEDGNFQTDETSADVIGVVIGWDDPAFPAEVLDRGQAQDRFGSDLVAWWEEIETEKLL